MPIAGQRDVEETRRVLEGWLTAQVGAPVQVTDLVVPQSSGFSNETFLFTGHWADAAGADDAHLLVLRSQPQVYALFPEIDVVSQQFQSMDLLGRHTDLPLARMRWAERDVAVLGQPFFVMDRLFGRVPGDRPEYTREGFVMDLAPEQRRELHTNGITAMARVGMTDWRAIGFDYLDQSHHGQLGTEQRRNYFRHYWQWARDGAEHPIVDPAWTWLEAHWPDDHERIDLCWGDARPGNQMYGEDLSVVGLFDWEMVSLGNAESDLGWWLFLQRYHTVGSGLPLPDGFLSRDETIALWESVTGRTAQHVDFYEKLAGFHFSLVMLRVGAMFKLLDPESWFPGFDVYNPVAQLTADLIGFDAPRVPTSA
jgi:aminoglycoside phosphotransferase (APT) family kinase protein